MLPSDSGSPSLPARFALSGVPPVPIQTGMGRAGRGAISASFSGARCFPLQVTRGSALSRMSSSRCSAKRAS
jgi:hypothetical protein